MEETAAKEIGAQISACRAKKSQLLSARLSERDESGNPKYGASDAKHLTKGFKREMKDFIKDQCKDAKLLGKVKVKTDKRFTKAKKLVKDVVLVDREGRISLLVSIQDAKRKCDAVCSEASTMLEKVEAYEQYEKELKELTGDRLEVVLRGEANVERDRIKNQRTVAEHPDELTDDMLREAQASAVKEHKAKKVAKAAAEEEKTKEAGDKEAVSKESGVKEASEVSEAPDTVGLDAEESTDNSSTSASNESDLEEDGIEDIEINPSQVEEDLTVKTSNKTFYGLTSEEIENIKNTQSTVQTALVSPASFLELKDSFAKAVSFKDVVNALEEAKSEGDFISAVVQIGTARETRNISISEIQESALNYLEGAEYDASAIMVLEDQGLRNTLDRIKNGGLAAEEVSKIFSLKATTDNELLDMEVVGQLGVDLGKAKNISDVIQAIERVEEDYDHIAGVYNGRPTKVSFSKIKQESLKMIRGEHHYTAMLQSIAGLSEALEKVQNSIMNPEKDAKEV